MVALIDSNFIMTGSLDDITIELLIMMQGISKLKRDEPDKYNTITYMMHKLVKEDDKARNIVIEFLENMHDIT